MPGLRRLAVGDHVCYQAVQTEKGPQGIRVRVIEMKI